MRSVLSLLLVGVCAGPFALAESSRAPQVEEDEEAYTYEREHGQEQFLREVSWKGHKHRRSPKKGFHGGPPPWAHAHGYRAKQCGCHPGAYGYSRRDPYRSGHYCSQHPRRYPPAQRGRHYPRGRAGGYVEIYF